MLFVKVRILDVDLSFERGDHTYLYVEIFPRRIPAQVLKFPSRTMWRQRSQEPRYVRNDGAKDDARLGQVQLVLNQGRRK